MPKQITIKRSGTVGLWKVSIDEHDIHFDGDTFTHDISPGEHLLQWFVRGGVGSTYTIEVTAPPEAKFSYSHTLDESERAGGHVWLKVTQ